MAHSSVPQLLAGRRDYEALLAGRSPSLDSQASARRVRTRASRLASPSPTLVFDRATSPNPRSAVLGVSDYHCERVLGAGIEP